MADLRQAGQMYSMKPIHQVDHVETPTTMYHMKSLHNNNNQDVEMADPDMKTLMEKDRKIASDLVTLTEEMKELSRRLGHTFGESGPVGVQSVGGCAGKPISVELPAGITDLVISTSLAQPALSAVLIGEFLKSNGVQVATVTQKHSSLVAPVPEHYFAITGGVTGRIQHSVDQLVFTFMWKEEAVCPSLMHSPKLQTRIVGDANIARYLCRILCPALYEEDNMDAAVDVDRWIETSVQMSTGSSKEKDSALKAMNAHLGKNEFFSNGKLTLADITLLGALLANAPHFKALPKNVKKWFVTMGGLFNNTLSTFDLPAAWTQSQ